jgi:antitoxin ParD1/3/4
MRVKMATMNISLPEVLKDFVDSQVDKRGYGTSSEYVRELIRKDQDAEELRAILLKGAKSPVVGMMDEAFFESMRQRSRKRGAG